MAVSMKGVYDTTINAEHAELAEKNT